MTTQPDDSAHLAATIRRLTAELVALFTQAERDLIAGVAADARRGLAAPVGSAARLAMLREMRATATRFAMRLHAQLGPLVEQIVAEAARSGNAQAIRTLTALVTSHPELLATLTRPQPEPVTALALAATARLQVDLVSRLEQATFRIVRFADDAYAAAVARAANVEILTGMSPAAAQRIAWDELTSRGITGFTDTRGRNWSLASYVEMATRTAVQRAYNAAHQDRMTAAGIDYFTVAPHAHPCPLCAPWEGAVLSDRHPVGDATTLSADGSGIASFAISATVDEATAAGLFHPNCTHTLVAYLPGVTALQPRKAWTAADQAAYDAAQRLRALERQVRGYKLQADGALNELDRARALRKARAVQARIRAHVEQHHLVRRRRREQLNLGNPG